MGTASQEFWQENMPIVENIEKQSVTQIQTVSQDFDAFLESNIEEIEEKLRAELEKKKQQTINEGGAAKEDQPLHQEPGKQLKFVI